MRVNILAGAIVVTVGAIGVGTAGPASAAGDDQTVGIEQRVGVPDGTQIAYTVTKILPSADPVGYPVAGRLYEATVTARAIQGTVVPLGQFFSARTPSGTNYPAIANASSLSGAPLADNTATDGKIYFDVVGPVPNSVVYDDPPAGVLTWAEPVAGDPSGGSTASSSSGGGSTGGSSTGGGSTSTGSQGVTGSNGGNEVSPTTSGGDIGGGQNGTEGGGGNLSSGGGSGAPTGNTGGHSGSGSGG